MNEEIKELTNRANYILDKLIDQNDSPDWSTERDLIEATGRLTYCDSEAIKTLKTFIEDHEEDIK